MTLMNVPDAELKLALVRTCGVGTIGSALGLPLSLPELLDDLALLPVLGRSLGGLLARRGVPLLLLVDLVARLGVSFVPLAFRYTAAPAVYAHASPSRTCALSDTGIASGNLCIPAVGRT